jgi:uncharacterized protein (TIGR04255 family)
MVWKLTRTAHRVYPRNPLAAVVADLRFHPILKVGSKIPDFQEAVRSVFTEYQEQPQQLVTVQPFGPMQVTQGMGYFFRKSTGTAALTLTTTSLTLDSRQHADRDQLINEACLGFDALVDLYKPVSAIRFGLRYINIIDRQPIIEDLGHEVAWQDLVTDKFCSVPSGLADADGTHYSVEVSSKLSDGGLTVRYGLLPDARDNREKFRFDSDRYVDGPVEAGEIRALLARFADDIYAVFTAAKGPALEEWMMKGAPA